MIGTPKVLKFKQLPETHGKGKAWYIQASMIFMIDVSKNATNGLVKVYIQGEGQDTASLDHILIKTLLGKEDGLGDQLTALMTSRTSSKSSPFPIDNEFHQWISYIDYIATPFAAYCIEPCPCYDAAHWLFISDLPFPGDGDYAGTFADFLTWCVESKCRGSAIGRVGEKPDYCSCCPVMPQTWDCDVAAGCVENFDGTGDYTTLQACVDTCSGGGAGCPNGYVDSDGDGNCEPCVYGCMDDTNCNYDALATCDDGSCIPAEIQNLSTDFNAFGSTDAIPIDGTPHSFGMHAYTRTAGEPVFGGHTTRGHGAGSQEGVNFGSTPAGVTNVYSEAYGFPMNCVVGQTYPISWWELVMAHRATGMCSDCLMGGWWVKVAEAPSGCIETSPGVWSGCGGTGSDFFDASASIYDPVANNTLTTVDALFHNSLSATNVIGNPDDENTAGASNGSHSEWNNKTTQFVATHPKMLVQFVVTTDWTQCTDCYSYPSSDKHGSYMGLTEVRLGGPPCPEEVVVE